MDSQSTPALEKVGGTKISRRTVTRGVAWSVPVAAVAYNAPAYASSQPPVLAGQCGVACKHPGEGNNNKTYHFVFCFKVGDEAVDNNTINLTNIVVGGVPRPAYSGTLADGTTPKTTVTVGGAGTTTCVFVDAEDFGTSETDPHAVLNFSYKIGGVTFTGCAVGVIVGDVCGTSSSSPLKDQPKNWPHDDGAGDPAATVCDPNPGDC